ncbi:hypothetical protein TCAL_05806 [Tigriopus californicus]|uniref:ABC transporter domain-containing protein n=1 Tax=Tigriopus californicus TaxID=6832 RepID=A0A553PQ93_TIGCA|nr:ATP-binding cassette sub-family F member 3-like [Tigriopus californicus]TRY79831.1 hypothetical protein TCAL_05806 [Tigriopus californicus]|eukprot:TCALIF_05806-PA protein Name:"Similar to Abcf3 ATP-binding cassette sub-family F member 3 (Mus musculus)" AED:0.09 eAED:0.09 QI:233/1/1/1/1/1/12/257/711
MEAKSQACAQLIRQHFPVIDADLFQYIQDVIQMSGDDFEHDEDVFEAVGGFLHECDMAKSEQDIKSLCEGIFGLLHGEDGNQSNGKSGQRVLDAPVQMKDIGGSETNGQEEPTGSIWIQKIEDNLSVDKKKLEKAEQMLLKKMDRKDKVEKPAANRYKSHEATASQVISKKDAKAEASNLQTKDIRIENFDISFGDHVLLRGAHLVLSFGRRYGMVGRNGMGKSTLLRMISSGQLVIPSHISILHVEQEVTGDDTIALQSVLESLEKRESLLREEKEINQTINDGGDPALSSRLTEIYAELEAMESDKAPSKASVILAGLGFTSEMQARPTKTFSGGWRMRLALARALFCKPDLLLLDEPTNMLDMQAIIWLERYLQTWSTTLLVVSHDRNFLDEVPTDMLHLHSQRIDNYRGNYTEFNNTMTERLKSQQREYEAQMDYRKHVQEFIDKFRFNAKRASLVQSRIKQLERLPELKPIEKETDVVLKFPDVEKLSPPILMLSTVTFAYDKNRTIFSNVDLSATMESRICIVGENGAGKTTLLKILMDQLSPTSGDRTSHRNLKFGYFSQHHVDQLDMSICSVELMQKEFPGFKVEEYRRMLGSFGVTGEMALQQISSLSGGQKSRVAFAILCAHKPNFLILDEPTNHLDIQTIEALGNGLLKYKGGVILVSHDERLIRMVCQELWVCSKGRVYSLDGGFDEYRAIIEKELVLA